MKIFSSKGCVYRVKSPDTTSYYSLSGITSSNINNPVLVSGVRLSGEDHIGKLYCFNDRRVANIVSKSFGLITISCIALLGTSTNISSFEAKLKSWIDSRRASQGSGKLALSTKGGTTYEFLLDGYTVGGVDREYNILVFELSGILLD